METEPQTRGRRPPPAEGWTPGAPEAARGREEPPLEPLQALWACPHPDLSLPASRTVPTYISVVPGHHVSQSLVHQPQETDETDPR